MKKNAFTIIELLVVISVISLLTAIFIPSLSKARQQAQSIYCMNNLRQMIYAAQVYLSDNDDFYPLAAIMDFDNPSKYYEWDFFRTFENGVIKQCNPGFLWQGESILKIQQCPVFKGNSNSDGDPYTGYNYNASYIGGFIIKCFDRLSGVNSVRNGEVKNPSGCAVFGDGQFILGANKFMRSPEHGKLDSDFENSYRYAGTQGYRHLGKTNVAYADGRIDSVGDVFSRTASEQIIQEYNQNNRIKVGFLSIDNRAYDCE